MKKILLRITFFLFFLSICVNAQESSYGVRLGANLSSISSDDITDDLEDSRFGIVVGFLAEFPVSEKINIQPEFQYSAQGNDDESLRVDYLQLPIFLKYNFNDRFNIHIGPQVGLKIWEWEQDGVIEADFNTFDFAAVAGLGVNLTENFFADLRYGFGLSNIIDDENIPGDFEGNSRNIQLSFGYKL
ncbi:porin family protein [Aquimarina gracilis]|uniref:Porin family protein n=1 Tax=Aquimarina gracilis TaxID=874422 RepID=A0ABU5ZXL8_9FLAO|nr:porin family protein [Aquimarina gracilis]MEB3346596.1 porin family protein [Aquimarina gracilis]